MKYDGFLLSKSHQPVQEAGAELELQRADIIYLLVNHKYLTYIASLFKIVACEHSNDIERL